LPLAPTGTNAKHCDSLIILISFFIVNCESRQ